MDEESFPPAHPAFAAHFVDPVYEDPADEFAPFGTDEGFDLLYEWAERRDELGAAATVADLLEESGFGEIVSALDVPEPAGAVPSAGGQVDAAFAVVGAAFTLLRLSGRIDEHGRQQTLAALDVLIDRFDAPAQLLRQRDDLRSWTT